MNSRKELGGAIVDLKPFVGNTLMSTMLKDKNVLANSVIYILEEYFPELRLIYSGSIALLEDDKGLRYKVYTSSSGMFKVSQSCTRGVGRDSSLGDWTKFKEDNLISKVILVNTSKSLELKVGIFNVEDVEGDYKF